MIGSLAAGFIGGAIGGALFGGDHSTVVKVNRGRNQMIEYHKWLENRRNDEMKRDSEHIDRIIHDKEFTCPKCHGKIEYKVYQQMTPEGKSLLLKIWCGCQTFKKVFNISPYSELRYDDDTWNQMRKFFNECAVSIRGEVDREQIRRDYMERKLKDRQEIERYYGKI